MRTVEIKGKIYFAGKDAANALRYSNLRDAMVMHSKGVAKHNSFKEGDQEITLISEGDMYRLITHSSKPKSFRALKRKYIADTHDLIDCYEAAGDLADLIKNANGQMDQGAAGRNT